MSSELLCSEDIITQVLICDTEFLFTAGLLPSPGVILLFLFLLSSTQSSGVGMDFWDDLGAQSEMERHILHRLLLNNLRAESIPYTAAFLL